MRERITGDNLTPDARQAVENLQGSQLFDGQVRLLTAPRWNDGKWIALANVSGSLCLIEVSLWKNPNQE